VESTQIEKEGKKFFCKYSDVPVSDNGWVVELKYLPISFDLVLLRMKDKSKPQTGWWNGRKWMGLRIKANDTITAWKRIINYDYYTFEGPCRNYQ
jgi:hypothetical protein